MKIRVKHIVYLIVFGLAIVNMTYFVMDRTWKYTGYPGLVAIAILFVYWAINAIVTRLISKSGQSSKKEKKKKEKKKKKDASTDEPENGETVDVAEGDSFSSPIGGFDSRSRYSEREKATDLSTEPVATRTEAVGLKRSVPIAPSSVDARSRSSKKSDSPKRGMKPDDLAVQSKVSPLAELPINKRKLGGSGISARTGLEPKRPSFEPRHFQPKTFVPKEEESSLPPRTTPRSRGKGSKK